MSQRPLLLSTLHVWYFGWSRTVWVNAPFSCNRLQTVWKFDWLIDGFIWKPNRLGVPSYRETHVSGKGVPKSRAWINIGMPQRRRQRVPQKWASKERRDCTRAVADVGQDMCYQEYMNSWCYVYIGFLFDLSHFFFRKDSWCHPLTRIYFLDVYYFRRFSFLGCESCRLGEPCKYPFILYSPASQKSITGDRWRLEECNSVILRLQT